MLVTTPVESSHVQMIDARLSGFVQIIDSRLCVFVLKLTSFLYSMQLDAVFDSRLPDL